MYTLKLPNGKEIEIETADDVFVPTYTSELCVKAAHKILYRPCTLLDLGCGCGVCGIAIAKMGFVTPPLYASDISEKAVRFAAKNAAINNVVLEGRCGSLFEPWRGMRFDCIIDDVSGVADDVARMSPWFANNIPCDCGNDGTALTMQILGQAGSHLNDGGILFFPVLSLSNTSKIIAKAQEKFRSVKKVVTQTWKLPNEMLPQLEYLREVKAQGRIKFEEKFGMVLCYTEIYKCMS